MVLPESSPGADDPKVRAAALVSEHLDKFGPLHARYFLRLGREEGIAPSDTTAGILRLHIEDKLALESDAHGVVLVPLGPEDRQRIAMNAIGRSLGRQSS